MKAAKNPIETRTGTLRTFVRNDEGVPVCPSCGATDFEQMMLDADARIKKQICEFAEYWRTGGAEIPRCGVSGRGGKCPRPAICEDARSGCQRVNTYHSPCGKMPGAKCPRDICPIRLMEWQVERNARRPR